MRFGINTLDDLTVTEKTVLLRVDINQPVDRATRTLTDITRIKACLPTIKELVEKRAKVVLLAHQGSDIEYKNFYTTEPHSKVLADLLGFPVRYIDDVCGPAAREAIKALAPGQVLLLDNVRFMAEEQTLFELKLELTPEEQAETLLVRKLAPLADLYVGDAFAAAHRSQPSLCGFQQILPSAMGRLFEEEYCVISNLMEKPARPAVFVLGGAKIADAFLMMDAILASNSADQILTGGLVANIMLWGRGCEIGEASKSFIRGQGYEGFVETARKLLNKYADKICLPGDLSSAPEARRRDYPISSLPDDEMLVDIGPKTAENYFQSIMAAKTVFVNGPMGVFEKPESEQGTRIIWDALKQTPAYTIIGGGDSIAATNKYGLTEDIDYICTGGGALIRFLTGEELPVVKALRHGSKISQ